jgi:hypothetical protein
MRLGMRRRFIQHLHGAPVTIPEFSTNKPPFRHNGRAAFAFGKGDRPGPGTD